MSTRHASAAIVVFASLTGASVLPLRAQTHSTWSNCCGTRPWSTAPAPSGMMGHGMMGGSMQRHHQAMMGNLPPAYANLSNPLPATSKTTDRGQKIYAAQCSSCHGPTGLGDGPAAKGLNPPPANLAWLSNMPMSRWDPIMYWTVAEGGTAYGTAMPAFKSTLTKEDIWAVVAYIQAHLPASTH